MSLSASAIPTETPADSAPGTAPDSPSPSAAPDAVPAAPLTLRQEEFCRHYAATGNAAGAAREAGYAEGSARQTGHDLLARPDIAGRVGAIRAAWRAVEREEAQILLGRLEQAWDAAVEQGSASLMIRVVKLQAELSGLDRRGAGRRAGLWPLPEKRAGEATGEMPGEATGEDAVPCPADTEPGPLAEAVRRGRHRTERALAAHRASRKALERRKDFDEADWLATARRLHATVEERRLPGTRPLSAMTNPDNSLHPAADAPVPDSAPDGSVPTDPDISLHRAGLVPAEDVDGSDREFREYRARADAVYLKYKLLDEQSARRRPAQTPPPRIGSRIGPGIGPGIATDHDGS